jgi:hypothetical protein
MNKNNLLISSTLLFIWLVGGTSGCCPFGERDVDPPVLHPFMEDSTDIYFGSYFNRPGASEITPENPEGLHRGMDLVAPISTVVKASAPGSVKRIIHTTEGFDHTNVLVEFNDRYTIDYNLESAQSITVTEGQSMNTGDAIGFLGVNPMVGPTVGVLDFGLLADNERICPIPYVTAELKILLEIWFDRSWTRTAEHPGPCTCHYTFP